MLAVVQEQDLDTAARALESLQLPVVHLASAGGFPGCLNTTPLVGLQTDREEDALRALAFGAGFGGNGTIIGSTANIIVATWSEKTRSPIKSRLWIRRGLPVMLLTCMIVSILYVIFYKSF